MALKQLAIAAFLATASLGVAQADHLLISEIAIDVLTEGDTLNTEEYVEIFNPAGSTVLLDNYYLTDFKNYYTITTLPSGVNSGTSDNMLKFPVGTQIAPGEVIVVCNKATLFLDRYFAGTLSNFTSQTGSPRLFESTESDVNIPNMTSLNTNGSTNWGFTNGGEHVVLFHWDGLTDLVQDVDVVAWGPSGTASNNFLFKDATTDADGPDGDTDTTAYVADAGSLTNLAFSPAPQILTRISTVESGEVQIGGNGLTGHDESLEDINTTFSGGADPGSATPGVTVLPFQGGNSAPAIAEAVRTPLYPNPITPVVIESAITDFETAVTSATLFADSGAGFVATSMTNSSGSTWTANLAPFSEDAAVRFYIQAEDTAGLISTYPITPNPFEAFIVDSTPVSSADLVINEIRYDLPGSDVYEYVELHNTRETQINVGYFTFGDATTNRYMLPAHATIEAGGFLVLANGFADFGLAYPDVTNVYDLGNIPFNNTGDTLRVFHANEPANPIDIVDYDEVSPWPTVGGTDKSLELRSPTLDNALPSSWVASPAVDGSPGAENSYLLGPTAATDWNLYE